MCNTCTKAKSKCKKCEKCLLSTTYENDYRVVVTCEEYLEDTDSSKKLSFDKHVDETIRSVTNADIDDTPNLLQNQLIEYDKLVSAITDIIDPCESEDNHEGFNQYQISRIDEVDNAIFELLKVITCNDNLKWDASVICPIGDMIMRFLVSKGYIIYYPTRVTHEDETTTISNFYSS